MARNADEASQTAHVFRTMATLLKPDRAFFVMAAIYGIGVSLLTLAVPISVQTLINTVANTNLLGPLVLLAATLFALLFVSGLLTALRQHLLEIFGRRFYARMTSEIALRVVLSRNPFFHEEGRADLFNRYFDIGTIQKNVPKLLIGGFTVVLQAVTGFILVSFYHPFFLAFNLIFVTCVALIWFIWGRNDLLSAIDLSHAKYAAARWLGNLGACDGFYRSERRIARALERTDEVTRDYVDTSRRHFRRAFTQSIAFLMLYAAASAALLALGGWLVIQNQLSLGQLVAAELVLSAIFLAVAEFSSYLDSFYDLFAGVEELGLFLEVPLEPPFPVTTAEPDGHEIAFLGARASRHGHSFEFDLRLPAGTRAYVGAADPDISTVFMRLLQRYIEPNAGLITLGRVDIEAMDVLRLRQDVVLVHGLAFPDCSVRAYLAVAAPEARAEAQLEVLRLVGLEDALQRIPGGLDAPLGPMGFPLSLSEAAALKLAGALLARPKVLLLDEICDLIAPERLAAALAGQNATILYFGHRRDGLGLSSYLALGARKQSFVESARALDGVHMAASDARVSVAT